MKKSISIYEKHRLVVSSLSVAQAAKYLDTQPMNIYRALETGYRVAGCDVVDINKEVAGYMDVITEALNGKHRRQVIGALQQIAEKVKAKTTPPPEPEPEPKGSCSLDTIPFDDDEEVFFED